MFSILIIASCGIYEDGPAFSIKTKRTIGEWELTSFNEGNEILSYKGVHAAEIDGCGTQSSIRIRTSLYIESGGFF